MKKKETKHRFGRDKWMHCKCEVKNMAWKPMVDKFPGLIINIEQSFYLHFFQCV
jgi:hypothetical protein